MNRKLVNGLLLLSVFTVGCGTFTSCKDNEEDYQSEILLSFNEQLKKAIEEVKCKCDPEFVKAMCNFLDLNETNPYGSKEGYNDIYELIAGYLKEKGATLNFKLEDGTMTTLGAEIAKLNDLNDFTYNKLFIQVLNNQADIATLQAQLQNMITSIEVNQAYNHIFGTLNFPIGLQSNILGAYYGSSEASFTFPGNYEITEVLSVDNPDLADITATNPFNVSEDNIYMDGDGNLGHLYLTINPADKDFTNLAALQLINSKGKVAPVTLKVAENSDDLLTFGWTRANGDLLGLYRVDASVDPAQVSEIAPKIDGELKNAFENALKDPNAGDLVGLGKILLDQLNGFLPAYAVQATTSYKGSSVVESEDADAVEPNKSSVAENDEATNQSVISKFEIAATAVHPLGFEFMSGVSINKKLPTFGPVSEAIESVLNDLKKKGELDFTDVTFEIGETSIVVKLNGAVDADGKEIGEITLGYDPNQGKVSTGNETALNPAFKDLEESVNELLESLRGNINNQVADIIKDIENKLLGKASSADRLLAKYNQLASKVNNFLANPNAALQVMLAYVASDGSIHRVSTDEKQPTILKAGNGVAQLLATTNTAEIIAPACKKLVSVISDNKADVDGVDLNKVISGRQHMVGFSAKPEATYKVAYSALDYRGKTSTKFYYIRVVE